MVNLCSSTMYGRESLLVLRPGELHGITLSIHENTHHCTHQIEILKTVKEHIADSLFSLKVQYYTFENS